MLAAPMRGNLQKAAQKLSKLHSRPWLRTSAAALGRAPTSAYRPPAAALRQPSAQMSLSAGAVTYEAPVGLRVGEQAALSVVTKVIEIDMGKAMIATAPIKAGQLIIAEKGEILDHPTMHSIQVSDTDHMNCFGDIIYANHSCDPNARMVPTPSSCSLVALRDISPQEFVTFDYDSTEWDMSDPFDCLCGAPACKSRVAGFRHLNPSALEAVRPELLSTFVRDVWNTRRQPSA